jgi:gamma-glutamylcyclotransferase (GGCT)/AIG2-like uncharacterized protein YtfP
VTQLYFAYGSNLIIEGMASRCPDSEPVGPAILHGWQLTFRGVADIERREGVQTHGALWRISDRDLERLDTYEGYPRMYARELAWACTGEEEAIAIVYVMRDNYLGLPSPMYLRTIKRGYEQWGLPVKNLDLAVARVEDRLRDLGITSFEPDGPKRLHGVRNLGASTTGDS